MVSAEEGSPVLQIYLLGRFRVVLDGCVLEEESWRRKKARQLFKCLLTQPYRRLSKDEAIDLFWPDSDPSSAATNLRSLVHAIRQTLDPTGGRRLLHTDRDTVGVATGVDVWLDVDEFEALVTRAHHSSDPLPFLAQADAMYEGDYLPEDNYEDWTTERRNGLRLAWNAVVYQLAQKLVEAGEVDDSIAVLQRLLKADSCNERAAQELMRLLVDAGRRPEALRIFDSLREALRLELEVEPSDRTLEERRRAVEPASPPAAQRLAAFRCAYPFPRPRQLIGRDAELGRLQRLVERGRTGGQAALIGAAAGAGKSALLGSLTEIARQSGVLCLAGGSYDERSGIPLAPFQEALTDYLLGAAVDASDRNLSSAASQLAEVVRLLRQHLGLAAATSEGSNGRMQLFGSILGFLQCLAQRGPVLLCLEDLHAADAATLHLCHYLVRQTRRLPLVILATYREEELRPGEPLAQLVALLARGRLADHIHLSALGEQDASRLAVSLLQRPINSGLDAALYAATEGNPLFIEQLVLALREEGRLDQPSDSWLQGLMHSSGVPVVIREVIGQRVGRLTTSGRQTLETAAVLGHAFDHATLLAVVEPAEESALLADLDEAIRAQVLRETGTGYAFAHSLIREGVYWGLSGPRRMLLHARAGATLEMLAGRDASCRAAELAYHFSLAGLAAPARAKALRYSLEAGRGAARLSSYRESLRHFARSYELIGDGDAADGMVRLEALDGRAQAERELAQWPESIASSRMILALSDSSVRRATAHGQIAYALLHTGDIRGVQDETAAGMVELTHVEGDEVNALRLYFHQVTAFVWFLQGRYRGVVELGRRMLSETVHIDRPDLATRAHLVTGYGHMGQGQIAEALEQDMQAVSAAERAGERIQLAIAHENLGLQSYLGGRFPAAREQVQRALAIFRDSASELRAVNALQHLCRIWVAEGDLDRAYDQASLAVELEVAGGERWAADGQQILGSIAILRARWNVARAHFAEALAIRRRVGDMGGTIESLISGGLVDQHVGNAAQAIHVYQEAVALAQQIDPGPPLLMAHRHLGRLALQMGERSVAARAIHFALALAEQMPESLEYSPTLLCMAEWYLQEGDLARALEFGERSLGAARPLEHRIEALVLVAQVHLSLGQLGTASVCTGEATAHAERLNAPRLLASANLVRDQIEGARATLAVRPP